MTDGWAHSTIEAFGAMTAIYGAPHGSAPKRTLVEAESELATAKASHAHANRALTNMAVQVSDVMDRNVALSEALRKAELEHTVAYDALFDRTTKLEAKLAAAQAQIIARESIDKAEEIKKG